MTHFASAKSIVNPKYFVVFWILAALFVGLLTALLLWLISNDPMNLRWTANLYVVYLIYYVVYGTLIGFAQSVVLQRFFAIRSWWFLSWLIAVLVVSCLNRVLDQLSWLIIVWVLIATSIQLLILKQSTPSFIHWFWVNIAAVLAGEAFTMLSLMALWFTEKGDAPSSLVTYVSLFLGIAVYGLITGYGLLRILQPRLTPQ